MRCKNDALLAKINAPKLSNQDEVSFTVLKDLKNCRRIKTKDVTGDADNTQGAYYKFLVPGNRFECLGEGCVNSGTYIAAATSLSETINGIRERYFARFDMTEVAAGAIAFYVYDQAKEAHAIDVTISNDVSASNADTYTTSVAATDYDVNGFAPVIIDLSAVPGNTSGTGWDAVAAGAYINILVKADTGANIGISSISLYESIEDFATVDVVKVGCLSSVGGSMDLTLIESACTKAQYNNQMTGMSYNVTGRTVTGNYYKLNPLIGKGSAVKGFIIANEERTIGEGGTIVLPDLYQEECRFITVQRVDHCDVTDATFVQLAVPTLHNGDIVLAEDHFAVIKNADGSTTLKFSSNTVGQKVLVSYPREVEVDERVANADNLNGTHVSMAVPVCISDRVKEMHVFNNVFITSFPNTISENDSDFSFTINIQPDKGGDYFHVYRIVE